jgi:hypothetical protein
LIRLARSAAQTTVDRRVLANASLWLNTLGAVGAMPTIELKLPNIRPRPKPAAETPEPTTHQHARKPPARVHGFGAATVAPPSNSRALVPYAEPHRATVESRSSTVVPRIGSPAVADLKGLLGFRGHPGLRGAIPKKSLTPQPSAGGDIDLNMGTPRATVSETSVALVLPGERPTTPQDGLVGQITAEASPCMSVAVQPLPPLAPSPDALRHERFSEDSRAQPLPLRQPSTQTRRPYRRGTQCV